MRERYSLDRTLLKLWAIALRGQTMFCRRFHAGESACPPAEFSGWKAEGIIAANGSNELISALLIVTVRRDKCVFIREQTFAF
jgi:histidinol-phosphate/aromatic aminotransferase/cobyric acid decarboxylase-like protein